MSHQAPVVDGLVSLTDLKALAIRLLAPSSTLRFIILAEPDFLPRHVFMARAGILVKLLYQELHTPT